MIVLLLTSIALLGCDENLSPRNHFETPFSIYGVISPDLDTQSVRVYAIEGFPTLGSDSIDAVVTAKDLTTGEIHTWTDSVIVDPNGQYEHIFWHPFAAEYGHRYHIAVTQGSDDARTSVDVQVPERATVHITNPDDPHVKVLVEVQDIQILTPAIEYVVSVGLPVLAYRISYRGKEKQVEQGWQVTVNMVIDRPLVQSWYNLDAPALTGSRCHAVTLQELILHVLVGDTVWNPPGGVFDPRVLSHPKTMSNVQNGFGFIGGGYRINQQLEPTRKAVEDACFFYPDPTR